ncbi:MAG: ATP-dependent Clp protease ATP-binding subunit, partial [Patescibacteria group bacterium]
MTDEPKQPLSEAELIGSMPIVAASAERPFDFGAQFDGTFYVWDRRLDGASIRLEKTSRQLERGLSILILAATILILVWFFANTLLFYPSGTLLALNFWTEPSYAQLPFWIGLALILLLIYRRARAKRAPKETGDYIKRTVTTQQTAWETAAHLGGDARVFIPDRCAPETLEALEDASNLAAQFKHGSLGVFHVFAGSLSQRSVGHAFARLGITFEQMKDPLARKMREQPAAGSAAVIVDPTGQQAILGAMLHTLLHGRTVVSPVDLFVSAYRSSAFLQELFYDMGVEDEAMEGVLGWLQTREILRARWQEFRKAGGLKPKKNMNRAMTAVATPMLDRVSEDVTSAAARGGVSLLIGRQAEMDRVLRVFEGGLRSVVLVGPPGVGKQAIVNGIAELMVKEHVPDMLKDRRLVRLDVGRLVAGATPAQAEERLLLALSEVARSRNIALAIPNIDDMVGISAGSAQSLDLSSLLATEMEKGYFVAIATATPQAYRGAIEGTALGNVLTKVDIDEPNKADAIQVLAGNVGGAEGQNQVVFSYAALEACVDLTARYIHDQYLPEKALRVLDEVALYTKQQKGVGAIVGREEVAHVVSGIAKVPLTAVTSDEKEKLLNLEEHMHKRMIGQDEAVNMVASALRRARAALRSGKRPIANFLFMGPTGVGKTELAKTIAESYFGNENAMIRLDMSEYQDAGSINRMLGVPGSGQGGVFTEAVRQAPFSLVLLDELEKAHTDILNLYLQVFDDGRLTDAVGRTIDFTQTIIVATSNVGARYIQDEIRKGTSMERIKTHLIEEELAKEYRPEFLNRFDGIVVFKPLTPDNVTAIARLMLARVVATMEEKGMALTVTDAALKELSVAGYDPQFGARPLRRVIQERVEDPLATLLLEGRAKRRDTIVLDAGGDLRVQAAP